MRPARTVALIALALLAAPAAYAEAPEPADHPVPTEDPVPTDGPTAYQVPGTAIGTARTRAAHVVARAKGIAVVDTLGRVTLHTVGKRVGVGAVLQGAPVAVQDVPVVHLVARDDDLLAINERGEVRVHHIGDKAGRGHLLEGVVPGVLEGDVAHVTIVDGRLVVVDTTSAVTVHTLDDRRLGPARRVTGPPLANGADLHTVLGHGSHLLAVTAAGEIWRHDLTRTLGPAWFAGRAPAVAAIPAPKGVVALPTGVGVVTAEGELWVTEIGR